MRLTLPKFKPEEIKPFRTILIIGKRGTGKSVLLEDILYHLRSHVDFGIFCTPTMDSKEMFTKHVPHSWVHEFKPELVESLSRTQRSMAVVKKRRMILVLDDCNADKRMWKSVGLRDIMYNGRHEKICFISSMQYCLDCPPDIRTNIDYVFALRDIVLANKQRLHKYFFGCFNRFDDFDRVLSDVTDNYGVLCLDNTCKTNNLTDMLSWYRASPNLPEFRLGKPVFWKLDACSITRTPEKTDRDERIHDVHKENE